MTGKKQQTQCDWGQVQSTLPEHEKNTTQRKECELVILKSLQYSS